MNERRKIFIEQEPQGDFVMRMPKEAVADLYQMITAAPMPARRIFYQVKQYLEENYKEAIVENKPVEAERRETQTEREQMERDGEGNKKGGRV